MLCPKCNAEMVKRAGKHGEFYGCSNYPRRCNGTRSLDGTLYVPPGLVLAGEIGDYEYFIKRTGQMVYKKVCEGSAAFHGLGDTESIFGVTLNGNLTRVKKDTLVWKATYVDWNREIHESQQWEKDMGCESLSIPE
jgi:ssDNA-binding Zn-finger/Zn-ribbon topoisomerase 1